MKYLLFFISVLTLVSWASKNSNDASIDQRKPSSTQSIKECSIVQNLYAKLTDATNSGGLPSNFIILQSRLAPEARSSKNKFSRKFV